MPKYDKYWTGTNWILNLSAVMALVYTGISKRGQSLAQRSTMLYYILMDIEPTPSKVLTPYNKVISEKSSI